MKGLPRKIVADDTAFCHLITGLKLDPRASVHPIPKERLVQMNVPEHPILAGLNDMRDALVVSKLAWSRSDAKRLIDAGAVQVNGVVTKERNVQLDEGDKIKVGKHYARFVEKVGE